MIIPEASSVSFSLTTLAFLPLADSDWKQEAASRSSLWEVAAGSEETALSPAGQADWAGVANLEGEGQVHLKGYWRGRPAWSPGQWAGGEVSAASKWASTSERHFITFWDRRGIPKEGDTVLWTKDTGERQEREMIISNGREWWFSGCLVPERLQRCRPQKVRRPAHALWSCQGLWSQTVLG